MFRLIVPVVAGIAVLAGTAPAWAGTVQIQDDAHVLNTTTVQNKAATFPVGVYVWTTTQDAASKSAFDTDVRNKVNSTFPIVIGINTQSRHETIQIGAAARVSQNAARTAETSANSAFVSTMKSNNDYTAAVTAALSNVRSSLAGSSRGVPRQRVRGPSSGISIWPIILIIGVIVAIVFLVRKRRRLGPQAPMAADPPPMGGPYPGSYPGGYPGGPVNYGPPQRSGMGAGAAGAIGAVGGGLLGYELGKAQGEERQYRQDEMMNDRDQSSAGQGDWVVGQDSDFGGGGSDGADSSGGGGDW